MVTLRVLLSLAVQTEMKLEQLEIYRISKSDPWLFLRERNGHKDFVPSWIDDLVYCRDDICFYETIEKTLIENFDQ